MKGSGYFKVEFGCWQATSLSSLHPDAVSAEGRHADGHGYRHLLWLLVGSLLLHLFPGISVQRPDHDGADAVAVGMYGGAARCASGRVACELFWKSLCKSALHWDNLEMVDS